MANTKIFLTFTENLLTVFGKNIFHKLVQHYFPKIFCGFSNFLKIVRKLTKNFPKNTDEFYQKDLAKFANFS